MWMAKNSNRFYNILFVKSIATDCTSRYTCGTICSYDILVLLDWAVASKHQLNITGWKLLSRYGVPSIFAICCVIELVTVRIMFVYSYDNFGVNNFGVDNLEMTIVRVIFLFV